MPTTLNITDLVRYKGERYRVSYFKKRIEDDFPNNPINLGKPDSRIPLDAPDDELREILEEEMANEKRERQARGLPHTRRFRYQTCTQLEATHVSLYGLTYPVAPINEVTYEGPITWAEDLIRKTQEEAVSVFRLECYPFSDWIWE